MPQGPHHHRVVNVKALPQMTYLVMRGTKFKIVKIQLVLTVNVDCAAVFSCKAVIAATGTLRCCSITV